MLWQQRPGFSPPRQRKKAIYERLLWVYERLPAYLSSGRVLQAKSAPSQSTSTSPRSPSINSMMSKPDELSRKLDARRLDRLISPEEQPRIRAPIEEQMLARVLDDPKRRERLRARLAPSTPRNTNSRPPSCFEKKTRACTLRRRRRVPYASTDPVHPFSGIGEPGGVVKEQVLRILVFRIRSDVRLY
jgi:hypothetical protein